MSIAVFTSNQPRHISLVNSLAARFSDVIAVLECNSVFPWSEPSSGPDGIPQLKLHEYFREVLRAEKEVFGAPAFIHPGVRVLSLRMGDLNRLSADSLRPALEAKNILVFGSSYIREPLVSSLEKRGALNIHMGISPFYRGSGTNFWPLFDDRPDLVGATIHRLTKGLDSGPILFHCAPKAAAMDTFLLGMRAVKVAHDAVIEHLASGALSQMEALPQNRALEHRYTRSADFTEAIAREFLSRKMSAEAVRRGIENRDPSNFVRLYTA